MSRSLPIALLLILSSCTSTPTAPPTSVTRAQPSRPDLSRPVATPVRPLARTTSQLSVAVRPLGSVPFDGITLPLTSPSGRYIATQRGPIPSWDALLAAPTPAGATIPVQLRISAFRILPPSGTPRDTSALREIAWSSTPPRGLLLGRSCDDSGFLVEHPQSRTGARWIGKLDWESGDIQWLVAPSDPTQPDTFVACFATLGPSGELCFCRAERPGQPFALVIRPDPADATRELTLNPPEGATFAMPLYAADSSRVYIYEVSAQPNARLAMLSIAVPQTADGKLTITNRIHWSVAPSIDAAYHCASPLQTPWPLGYPGSPNRTSESPSEYPALPSGIPLVSPETGSMCWYDGLSTTTLPLARATLGATPLLIPSSRGDLHCSGLLLGAAGELVFQPITAISPPQFGTDAAVLNGAYLARLTTPEGNTAPRYLLLSPPLPSESPDVGVSELTPLP